MTKRKRGSSSTFVGGSSLEASLERRLVPMVLQYQEQVQSDGDASGSKPSARNPKFDTEAILQFVVQKDRSLQRKGERILRKAIEGACDHIKKNSVESASGNQDEADEHSNESEGNEVDSDLEVDPSVRLVEVKDTNFLNRSLANLYQKKDSSSSPAPAGSQAEAPDVGEASTPTANTAPADSAETPKPEAVALDDKKTKRSKAEKEERKPKKVKETASSKWPTPTKRLSDLGGIDHCIEEVLQLIGMPLKHPEIYLHLGIQPPRGILLHGPPGCGKTLLANAIAGEAAVPFVSISAPSVVSGMSGESEKKIREVFEEAKELAPCLLFIDEIDAITPKRETAQREMERRIVAQLLTCMDDLSLEKTNNKPVLIIGATNRPDALDPALRRAGRFDREISMGVPDEDGRTKILEKLCSKLRLAGDLDCRKLAKLTPGFVGADLNALTAEAGAVAVKRIFHEIRNVSADTPGDADLEMQDAEGDSAKLTAGIHSVVTGHSSISDFLDARPTPLTEDELEPLCITLDDFLAAVKQVQPSAKREGFATVPDVSWDDIGALELVRQELRMAVVEPVKHPDLFLRVGITSPMGVLLYGPPGCGKTLLAKAVANESQCNFISVKGPELLNKYVGESERSVRQVFARAAASAPCVIFFDELDALCPARSNDADSQSSSRLVNTLLTEMDGMQGRKQVFVLAATNRPDMIDPAMLRPGRLDKALYVDLPNPQERLDILKTITRKTPLKDVDLALIATDPRCDGLSGADLSSLVREAAIAALRASLFRDGTLSVESDSNAELWVTRREFDVAFAKVSPSVSKKDQKRYQLLKVKFGNAAHAQGDSDAGNETTQ
ncbi:ribosome biogenesis ATPase RIX7 [Polychytrium aggregatum]|uniref:ribosome biogenesis ATPase RIX7 n=1 Tax=Polychytrium aggregatum TaxID=110093 RepID=UPI0022FE80CA|nr:ribosome biogenesis ATPase RIX7 [Polychytrium aggregatum]KAI9209680.1 ribosome biogenesis ATPase RIX7 [Polychytrium aggregatum]